MKKILLIADQKSQYDDFQAKQIKDILKRLEPYGVEIKTILDNGLDCNGDDTDAALLKIEKEGPEWVRHDAEFLKEVADANIIIVHFSAVGKMLLDAAKQLELVVTMRGGLENINIPLCTEKGIAVSNSPGRNAEQVSDMTMALILAFNRNIPQNDLVIHKGFTLNYPHNPFLVKDMTIGLVGFGGIARMAAKKLSGCGCNIIAYDPYVSEDIAKEYNVKLVPLDQLMATSDAISVHARLLPATKNLIGRRELELMQPHAFFVNTARAGLVDEEALIDLLKSKKIRGAALDVFSVEPLPDDHILRTLDNVILTPHIAGRIEDGYRISVDIVINEIERYLKGDKLCHKVN